MRYRNKPVSPSNHRPRILVIASRGGHWAQLRRLRPAFEGCETVWASTDASLVSSVSPERFVAVPDASRWTYVRLVWSAIKIAAIVLRLRPDVVVSTGAAPGYLAIRAARMVGARTLWIDSFANSVELSLSGREARRHVSLMLTQWEHLGRPLPPPGERKPGVVYYAGEIL